MGFNAQNAQGNFEGKTWEENEVKDEKLRRGGK